MDIKDQRETFHGFLITSVWVVGLLAQWISMLTLAFAIDDGWWSGYVVFVVIGVLLGILFRMSGVYWAVQVAFWVLLGIGGLVVPALAGLMH
jgi:hypothetical protein